MAAKSPRAKRNRKRQAKAYRERNRVSAKDKLLRHKYGISIEIRDGILIGQGSCCAICLTGTPHKTRDWAVDHCHVSGKVRGVLCHRCNVGLGMLQDSPIFLRRAAEYLEVAHG